MTWFAHRRADGAVASIHREPQPGYAEEELPDDAPTARTRGDVGGEEAHANTISEMPAHTHTFPTQVNAQVGSTADGGGGVASPTSSTGGSGAHNTMMPYGVANWIIKT